MGMSAFTVRNWTGVIVLAGTVALSGTSNKSLFNKHEKAFYLDQATVDFVRPGLMVTINSASVSSSGAITVTYTITDPKGLPLDAAGVTTPGARCIALTWRRSSPKARSNTCPTLRRRRPARRWEPSPARLSKRAAPASRWRPGQYQYTFTAPGPGGIRPHRDHHGGGRWASRSDRSSIWARTMPAPPSTSFPTAQPVRSLATSSVPRVATLCHDQLAFHGGHAQGIEMCVLCHQPQNADPTTGNSLDLKVMAHKIHMGVAIAQRCAARPAFPMRSPAT